MESKNLEIPEQAAGQRADLYLPAALGITRSAVQHLAERGLIRRGEDPIVKNEKLRAGERITVFLPDPEPSEMRPEAIPLDVVYEDGDLLVVNKPKGMVVHPAAGNPDGTLANALLAHCGEQLSGINGVCRPGIVHRIDKDTSGLLIVAKNDLAHVGLAEQIKAHSFTRRYEAIVCGHLKQPQGTVDAPIGRHPTDRKKMAVTDRNARSAVTHYTVLAEYRGYSHLRLQLETGRTHQIRVHMAYLGHPVAGDPVYGHDKPPVPLQGQCLHARTIGFVHPRTGEYMEFTSDLPEYFERFLSVLRQESAR